MGCNESKSSVATGNTITQSKKPAAAEADSIDMPKNVDESAVVPLEEKGSEGSADVKEGTQDAKVAAEVEKKDDVEEEDEREKPERAEWNVKEEKAVEEKEPEKENGAKEVANNEDGLTREAEPAPEAPSPTVAKTVDAAVPEQVNPTKKKE